MDRLQIYAKRRPQQQVKQHHRPADENQDLENVRDRTPPSRLAEKVQTELASTAQSQEAAGQPAVLLVTPGLRPWLARFLRFAIPSLKVLAYNEVPDSQRIRLVAAVGG